MVGFCCPCPVTVTAETWFRAAAALLLLLLSCRFSWRWISWAGNHPGCAGMGHSVPPEPRRIGNDFRFQHVLELLQLERFTAADTPLLLLRLFSPKIRKVGALDFFFFLLFLLLLFLPKFSGIAPEPRRNLQFHRTGHKRTSTEPTCPVKICTHSRTTK